MLKKLKLGTRASKLALWQAGQLKKTLAKLQVECEIIKIQSTADKTDKPLQAIGGKGLFTKELDSAILNGEIDIAIHSAKDVPAEINKKLLLLPVLKRGLSEDIFISNLKLEANDISKFKNKLVIGTSSQRRAAQLLEMNKSIIIKPLRGNIETRIEKLKKGEFDAIILAAAALARLKIKQGNRLNKKYFIPALTQGCLAVTLLKNNKSLVKIIKTLADEKLNIQFAAERSFLERLNGDCYTALAGYSAIKSNKIYLLAKLFLEGKKSIVVQDFADIKDAKKLGLKLANKMLKQI